MADASLPVHERSAHAGRRAAPLGVGALLLFVALFIATDVLVDIVSGTAATHIVLQVLAASVAMPVALLVWRARRDEVEALRLDLSRTRREADRWRAEAKDAVEGFSLAMDRQFDRWGLTEAEREVCLLLLKGLSLKEVAGARKTSERTAREQAGAVYRKSGLSGRAELAAFFLEDLLAPRS